MKEQKFFLLTIMAKRLVKELIEKILVKENKTNIARVNATSLTRNQLTEVRGFIVKRIIPGTCCISKMHLRSNQKSMFAIAMMLAWIKFLK